jgi:hypothetical protein
VAAVILRKKFWHACVVKLKDSESSRACGNGVGSGGGDEGMVGTAWEGSELFCEEVGEASGLGSRLCVCRWESTLSLTDVAGGDSWRPAK